MVCSLKILISALALISTFAQPQANAALCSELGSIPAGSDGDYRSVRTGNWNNDSTWARCVAGVWSTPAPPPDSGSGVITVRTGHVVTIRSTIVYDQLLVEDGAQVVVASGVTHTLADGPGNDLTINGTWVNQGGTWNINGSARWVVNDGGVFVQSTSSGISTPLSKATFSTASTFVYRGGAAQTPASSFSGRTYGNLLLDTSGGAWTCSATGSGALVVNGNLSLGPGVKWSTGGYSGTVSIKGGTMIAGEWTGTGSGNQGVHTFVGPFTVQGSGKYSLSTSGAVQGSLVFQSDLFIGGMFVTPANRPITLNGQIGQSLSGSAAVVFNSKVLINNSAGVILQCPVSIEDTLQCMVGILHAESQTLSLGPRALLLEVGSAYVAGRIAVTRVLQIGVSEAFGNLGLEFQPITSFAGSMTVTRVSTTPSSLSGVRAVSRYFDIVPSVPSNSSAHIGFSATGCGFSGMNLANLRLYRSTDRGGSWTDEGGIVDLGRNLISVDGVVCDARWTAGEPIPVPTISGVNPACADVGSSLTVSIAGTGFLPGQSILEFSGMGITVGPVTVASASLMSARIDVSPVAAPGFRSVCVRNDSIRTSTLANAFEVRIHLNPCPIISGLDPASGLRGSTIETIIRGHGFMSGLSTVSLGDGITIGSCKVMGDSNLIVPLTISRGTVPGLRDVVVTNPSPGGGQFVLPNAFALLNPVPSITAVSPNTLVRGESAWIAIQGKDMFPGATQIEIGEGIGVDSLIVESSASARAKLSVAVSTKTGLRDLKVVNGPPGGGIAALPGILGVVNPVPLLRSFIPDSVMVGELTEIELDGSGFIPGATRVQIGNGVLIDSVVMPCGSKLNVFTHVMGYAVLGPRDVTVSNDSPGGGASKLTGKLIVKSPRPTLSSISPASAVTGEHARIILRGGGFVPGLTRVDFGPGVTVDSVVFDDSSHMQTAVSISSSVKGGTRDVTLMNPGPGGGSSCLAGALMLNNAIPAVTSLSATSGIRGDKFTIMVVGRSFVQGVTSIAIGEGVAVDSIRVTSSDCLFAWIMINRLASTGLRDVLVSNVQPGGGSQLLRAAFEIRNPSPIIREIDPNVICVGDTGSLRISGSGYLDHETSVNLGPGISVRRTIVDSLGTMMTLNIAVDSIAESGCRTVIVSTAGPGGGRASLPGTFTLVYPVPVLTAISPLGANRPQTLTVAAQGRFFIPAATMLSLGADIVVHTVVVKNSTELSCTVTIGAEAAIGQRSVVVSNPKPGGGASALTNSFTIANSAPMLTRVIPSSGVRGDTLSVLLEGMNFTREGTTASFGDSTSVLSFSIQDAFRMTARVAIAPGATVGPREVVLSTAEPGGGVYRLVNALLVVNPSPTAASVSPSSGYKGRSLTVTISGSHFETGMTSVDFGPGISVTGLTIPSSVMLLADILIDAGANSGARSVIVRNCAPGGGSTVLSRAFAALNPSPSLASVIPSECFAGSAAWLRLVGNGFIAGETTAGFGEGIVTDSIEVRSVTEIMVHITADRQANSGYRDVSVLNSPPGGGTAILSNVFLVKPELVSGVDDALRRQVSHFELSGAYPNPFNSRTAISYELAAISLVKLSIFDLLGKEVATLVEGEQDAGPRHAWLDARSMTSGMYIVRLTAQPVNSRRSFVASQKIILLR